MNTGRTGRRLWWATAVVASFTVLTFLSHGAAQTTSSTKVRLEGAGATFPAPLYKKWIGLYASQNPDVSIEYRDVGSGEGVKRFLAQSVDFGASDGALTDEQMATLKPGARLVPATAGIVVLAYNLPGIGGQLRLSREVYADIFLRKIDKWNDPRLQAINPPRLGIVGDQARPGPGRVADLSVGKRASGACQGRV
jgi:phosphate transport system substrate-binding protein